jgi:predicted acylesterase/phospholipase RssA
MSSPSATGATPDGSRARPAFERIALLLQGGGALGAYQAGVYQALAEADLRPDWVAGISIGAINSALIAGNPPEKRGERLRAFWETVTQPPLLPRGRDGEGAWSGPAALQFFDHAMCDVNRLPVREVVSASHFVTDLTLGLGEVVFDYLAK